MVQYNVGARPRKPILKAPLPCCAASLSFSFFTLSSPSRPPRANSTRAGTACFAFHLPPLRPLLLQIISAILTIVSMGIRFYTRSIGWDRHPGWVPYDAELLAISVWLGYFYLMYYVRCFRHVGRLVIALVQARTAAAARRRRCPE